ncbi:MAG: N-acetylmuramoyl-L-alanine amidase [Desulfitobacteriaceae bacterium]
MLKPDITWKGSPNFSSPKGYKILAIVDHIMSGTLEGTDSWFNNPAGQVSSHFGIGKNGKIHQYVDLGNPAWANGGVNRPNWPLLLPGVNPNYYTVSIEHEGESGDVMPEAQYQATLALHRWLIDSLGIPVTRDNIIGHYRIDSVNKSNCPGTGFPWDRLFLDLQGGDKVKDAVLYFGEDDIVSARRVSEKLGNCAMYMRKPDRSFNQDCLKAKHLVVVGGASVGHPNETLLSGNSWADTAMAVENYLSM